MSAKECSCDETDSSNEEIHFQIAMKALKASKSDTEKFCALLIIAKFLKPNKLRDDQIYLLFKEIGWKFLYRLLLTDGHCGSVPEGCKSTIFQSISTNILTCLFLTNLQLLEEPACVKIFARFAEMIVSYSRSENEDEKELVLDALHCCETFTMCCYSDEEVIRILSSSNMIKTLVDQALDEGYGSESCFQVLHKILLRQWAKADLNSYNNFLQTIAEKFKTNNDQKKFDLCQQIPLYLLNNACFCSLDNEEVAKWVSLLTEGLFQIFRSRLSDELRKPAFMLSSSLTEAFESLDWTHSLRDSNASESNKLFLLLVRLVCVEINIQLDSQNMDYALLASCFIILEKSISAIANDEDQQKYLKNMSSDEIIHLLSAIKETMLSIISFLQTMRFQWDELSNDCDRFVTTLGCIRLLCFWITEETEALKKEIRDILPFILQVLCSEMKKGSECVVPVAEVVIPAIHSLCVNDSEVKAILNGADIVRQIEDYISANDHNDEIEHICSCLKKLCE